MGSVNSNQSTVNQTIANSILQTATIGCAATCENIDSGNVTVIIGGNYGNITFSQKCTADATCVIDNALNSSVDNILASTLSQEAVSSGLAGRLYSGNTNLADIKQTIKNTIVQNTDIQCSGSSTNIRTGNLVYLQDVTAQNLAFTQEGNALAQCYISNLSKLDLTNSARSTVDQKAKDTGIDLFAIFGIIAAVIIAIIIFILLFKFAPKRTPAAKPAAPATPAKPGVKSPSSASAKPPPLPARK